MKGVRFTKAERTWLVDALERYPLDRGTQKFLKLRDSILSKIETAGMPVKKSALAVNVTEAIRAFSGVLSGRLIIPPVTAVGVRSAMKRRLDALGLTLNDCVIVAKQAGATWRGPIRAESLVRQADKLIAESQQEIAWSGPERTDSPVELRDDEI